MLYCLRSNVYPTIVLTFIHISAAAKTQWLSQYSVHKHKPRSFHHHLPLTSLKLNLPSKSSSTSLIMFFRPKWVCGAPNFSISIFSSIRSMKPSFPVSNLKTAKRQPRSGEGKAAANAAWVKAVQVLKLKSEWLSSNRSSGRTPHQQIQPHDQQLLWL